MVQALQRRRAAGTLLKGKCSAAEEAWFVAEMRRANARLTAEQAAQAAGFAAAMGYAEFLATADTVLLLLRTARAFAVECSDTTQFASFVEFVEQAAELMQQPWRRDAFASGKEAEFAKEFRKAVAVAGANGLDARLVQRLAGAWQRLQHSGALPARRDEAERVQSPAPEKCAAFAAAIRKSLTAPDLRTCALLGCGAKEARPAHFKSCAACRTVVYCCRKHQVEGWPSHKKACKAARTAAAEKDEAGAGPSGA